MVYIFALSTICDKSLIIINPLHTCTYALKQILDIIIEITLDKHNVFFSKIL